MFRPIPGLFSEGGKNSSGTEAGSQGGAPGRDLPVGSPKDSFQRGGLANANAVWARGREGARVMVGATDVVVRLLALWCSVDSLAVAATAMHNNAGHVCCRLVFIIPCHTPVPWHFTGIYRPQPVSKYRARSGEEWSLQFYSAWRREHCGSYYHG